MDLVCMCVCACVWFSVEILLGIHKHIGSMAACKEHILVSMIQESWVLSCPHKGQKRTLEWDAQRRNSINGKVWQKTLESYTSVCTVVYELWKQTALFYSMQGFFFCQVIVTPLGKHRNPFRCRIVATLKTCLVHALQSMQKMCVISSECLSHQYDGYINRHCTSLPVD